MERPFSTAVKLMSICSWNGTIRPPALIAHIVEKQGERSAGTQVVVEFVIALLGTGNLLSRDAEGAAVRAWHR
jgi:hypothetical protein